MSVRVSWHPRLAMAAVDHGGNKGVTSAMDRVKTAADKRVPLLSGRLRDTGRVTSDGLTANLSYDTVYAAKLHAHPEYQFGNGREARWVEDAITETALDVKGDIAAGIRERMR